MEPERIASDLLWPIWRGLDSSYKSRYRQNIWEQFENNIRSAAYTGDLRRFYDNLSRKLSFAVRTDDVKAVEAVLSSEAARLILKALRDETVYLVLLVRLRNEERKAEYEEQKELF